MDTSDLVQVKPHIEHTSYCPYCKTKLALGSYFCQGLHMCVETSCSSCGTEFVEDLRVGHAVSYAYQVDLQRSKVLGPLGAMPWLGRPLLNSLLHPNAGVLSIQRQVYRSFRSVTILNCLDALYGHSLLKLLNATNHLKGDPARGVIVLIPNWLRWLVPTGVAEVWSVEIPLRQGQNYYLQLRDFVRKCTNEYEEIFISKAYSHPGNFILEHFTRVPPVLFTSVRPRVTFIWREDRPWLEQSIVKIARKLGLMSFVLARQNRKIHRLFSLLRKQIPDARFTVAGLGTSTRFVPWITDCRVQRYDAESEREMCCLYAESALVIGIHGSNMLLPSGHARMTIDLMPEDRWGNFAQDILYQEEDPRIAAYRYRYLPFDLQISLLARIATLMLAGHDRYCLRMHSRAMNQDPSGAGSHIESSTGI